MKVQDHPYPHVDLRSVLSTGAARAHAGAARACDGAARAYDGAGADYVAYADGDATQPFAFSSHYAYADRIIWQKLESKLLQLAGDGRRTLRILDAGCGPGTWLRRIVLSATELGFTTIEACGIDISPNMVAMANIAMAAERSTATMNIVVGDLSECLPYADDFFDITLCLYGVLNHLPEAARGRVAAELVRVTLDTCFVSARAVGSLPTVYVDELKHARSYRQDNEADWMDVDLVDGRHLGFPSHLFTNAGIRGLFQPHLRNVATFGLDVFHSRFATDPDWNPASIAGQPAFEEALAGLEAAYASNQAFIDRAAHILLIGECADGGLPGRACLFSEEQPLFG